MSVAIARVFEPDYDNGGNDLDIIAYRAADAALRVIETPKSTDADDILPCTCGHNGYGKHQLGCELYESV